MKTNQTIRSIVAMMVIFFAVATTSCKKENDVTPNPVVNTPPNIPVTPVTPSVSMKPRSIITSEGNTTTRKEEYQYDTQGKLKVYLSSSVISGLDSVSIQSTGITFSIGNANQRARQVLTLNTDKTFKTLTLPTSQIDFVNNQTQLSRMFKPSANSTPLSLGEFAYSNNNLSRIGAEVKIDINYDNNLPYQKGINEIPVALKPMQHFKILEMENVTSTTLYSKLIKQVIIQSGASRFEIHDYVYVLDANNRVTKITDTITNTTATTSAQRILIRTITY